MYLKKNVKGSAVRELCKNLKKLGYYSGPETELFDNDVYKAVKAFQMQNVDSAGRPLVVDGIVGPLTLEAINRRPEGVAPPVIGPVETKPSLANGGSPTARAALKKALDELADGACEIGGNNCGKYVKKYLNGMAEEGSAWCAAFVSWCFKNSGHPMPFKYTLGARNLLGQLKAKKLVIKPTLANPPIPGDIIVWWRGAPKGWKGHVGFVLDYRDGVVRTVEGNKSNRVQIFSYTLDKIDRLLGFARIP